MSFVLINTVSSEWKLFCTMSNNYLLCHQTCDAVRLNGQKKVRSLNFHTSLRWQTLNRFDQMCCKHNSKCHTLRNASTSNAAEYHCDSSDLYLEEKSLDHEDKLRFIRLNQLKRLTTQSYSWTTRISCVVFVFHQQISPTVVLQMYHSIS